MRFNRYIVECKYIDVWYKTIITNDLIDTQWNVNAYARYKDNVAQEI